MFKGSLGDQDERTIFHLNTPFAEIHCDVYSGITIHSSSTWTLWTCIRIHFETDFFYCCIVHNFYYHTVSFVHLTMSVIVFLFVSLKFLDLMSSRPVHALTNVKLRSALPPFTRFHHGQHRCQELWVASLSARLVCSMSELRGRIL